MLPILPIQEISNAFVAEMDPEEELHTAIREGKVKRVKELLANGISATKKNGEGMAPLDTAAIAGKVDIFKTVFIEASRIERKKADYKNLVKKWNDAVGSLKDDTEAHRVQLQSAIQEMSSVQYVAAYRLYMCFCRSHYMWFVTIYLTYVYYISL